MAGTDRETSKKYKLQHTYAFVSGNSENECCLVASFVGRLLSEGGQTLSSLTEQVVLRP